VLSRASEVFGCDARINKILLLKLGEWAARAQRIAMSHCRRLRSRFGSRRERARLRYVLCFAFHVVCCVSYCETVRSHKKKLRDPFGSRSLVRKPDLGQLVLAGLIRLTFVKGLASTAEYDGGALATGVSVLRSVGTSTLRRIGCSVLAKSLW